MGFALIGRHQQREQQIDRLIVDGVESDGLVETDKHANGPQCVLFQFAVGNGDTVADTGAAHALPVRTASNTTCEGRLSCLAASSLIISKARFLLVQCTELLVHSMFNTELNCIYSLFISSSLKTALPGVPGKAVFRRF